ncbi:50S ribosomal protein L11 methyltransferase [bacterium]|nr:50S ribosomal protein L11 methyltransferase [bacterium]
MTHPICYELRIHIDDNHKDSLVNILHEFDESNFVEGALDCDVEFEYDYEHLSRDYYGELVRQVPVILYSEDLQHLEDLRANLLTEMNSRSIPISEKQIVLQPIADQNWRESWKASFKPIDIAGQFAILPPWENPADFRQPHKIIIDPGMAFGTGQHETTKLCLELLLEQKTVPQKVFDVGTGSGILAIAASMLGSKIITGNDIDENSVHIAKVNARDNKIENTNFVSTSIEDIEDRDFDLIFANIQLRPLTKIFGDIVGHTRPGGTIIVSGILNTEIDDFRELVVRSGAEVKKVVSLGHWSGIVCERPQVNSKQV